jgi:cobalt/nickel transport system ATP-binding protein
VDLAYRWADEVILMKDGGVVRRGTGQEVFGDVDLIRDARLKLPLVVDLYRELAGRGIARGSKPPKNILELCDLLQPKSGSRAGAIGKIYICNVDEAGEEEVVTMLEGISVDFKGAMGTSAKVVAEKCGISIDFTYGVIDKCILKALIGKDTIIMTSGGMVDHTLQRIRDYGQESGTKIEAVRLLQ